MSPERIAVTRRLATCCALLSALGIPAGARAAAPPTVASGSESGIVTAISASSFTIQTAGPRVGVVNALVQAANSVTQRAYPYVYGGGHAQAGIPSTGVQPRRSKKHPVGFDCSGSVAAVLADAGLWPAGSGVPNDAGVIATLRSQHLIVPGVGRGPLQVTVYDHPGVHIFINIDGRFFGTSDGAGGGNPKGGAGWLDDGAPDAARRVYKAYHFVASVLRSSTNAGHIVSFQLTSLVDPPAFQVGDTLQVAYSENGAGSLLATSVAFPGSVVTTGTVTGVAADGSSFTLQTPSGQTLALAVIDPRLVLALSVGDTVQVTYTTSANTQTARTVTVTATPPAATPPGTGSNT
jgi:hypothetical protein